MTTYTDQTTFKNKRAKKKVSIVTYIEPDQDNAETFLLPSIELRDCTVAMVQYGGSWRKMCWEPVPSMVRDRDRLNEKATALLRQPSTVLLKGPLCLSDAEVRGAAFLVHRTMHMPFIRVRQGIDLMEADERIERMLVGWGAVSWDREGLIVICEDERDLFGAKMAVG